MLCCYNLFENLRFNPLGNFEGCCSYKTYNSFRKTNLTNNIMEQINHPIIVMMRENVINKFNPVNNPRHKAAGMINASSALCRAPNPAKSWRWVPRSREVFDKTTW